MTIVYRSPVKIQQETSIEQGKYSISMARELNIMFFKT
jgi:hypothetical protein